MAGSNDVIRSTVHRVRAPPQMKVVDGMTPERYSIPYVRRCHRVLTSSKPLIWIATVVLRPGECGCFEYICMQVY